MNAIDAILNRQKIDNLGNLLFLKAMKKIKC